MFAPKRITFPFVLILFTLNLLGQNSPHRAHTAWEQLIASDPSAVDDPSITWQERLVLDALTPKQADRWYRGAGAETLLLDNGQTLKEYLEDRLSPPASLFVPVPGSCTLFSSEGIEADQRYGIQVRAEDLSVQGGSLRGCNIPEEATSLMIRLRMESLDGGVRIKLWASDGPEPASAVLETAAGEFGVEQTTAVLRLPSGMDSLNDLERRRVRPPANHRNHDSS